MKGSFKKWGVIGAGSIVVLILLAEVGLRMGGAIDFATYDVDPKIGYVPEPNQSGSFLNSRDWVLNDRAFGARQDWSKRSPSRKNMLVVGDSVVWGGNPLIENDRLGPSLEKQMGPPWQIWPAAAGGWSIANELEFMRRNIDVYRSADLAVWVINSGDMQPLAAFDSDQAHPRARPPSALFYYLDKYALSKLKTRNTAENPAIEDGARIEPAALEAFSSFVRNERSGDTLIVIYPDVDDLTVQATDFRRYALAFADLCKGKVHCVDVSTQGTWGKAMYRDGIHPSGQGNRALAQIIGNEVDAWQSMPKPVGASPALH
jgi:hypothetical protein